LHKIPDNSNPSVVPILDPVSKAQQQTTEYSPLARTGSLCSDILLHMAHKPVDRDYFNVRQESRAIARKPRDAGAVIFGLKFADNIHYKFKSNQASKPLKPGFRPPNIPAQNRI